MKICCVQFDIAWQDPAESFYRLGKCMDSEDIPAGSLIVLPEMFATGFSMELDQTAQPEGGPAETFLAELAEQYDSHVIGGVARRVDADRGSNEALVFAPDGSLRARYAKIHPFTPLAEQETYAPGQELQIVEIGGLKVCPLICYDLRFCRTFRTAALDHGAEMFVVIANWPRTRGDHWSILLRARAIENQAFVVGVNRVGEDPELAYLGDSVIVGPDGRVLADAGQRPLAMQAEIDPEQVAKARQALPFLADAGNQPTG